MRKITVLSMITLDGVMQAPGGPQEDTSGDFKYGGWTASYSDELFGKIMKEELKPADYLLGRKTYEIFASYWPQHADFWPGINDGTKYVLSQTMEKSDIGKIPFSSKVWQISKSSRIRKVLTFRFGAVVSSFNCCLSMTW